MTINILSDQGLNVLDKQREVGYLKRKLIIKAPESDDVNCPDCGALLYKVLFKSRGTIIEVKCRRCGRLHRGL